MNNTSKLVLVTGGAGFIGSVLVRQLLAGGYRVRVLDILAAGGDSLFEVATHPNFEFLKIDLRDAAATAKAVKGCWAVAHLAAIVGDPACKMEPELTKAVNVVAAKHLHQLAEQAGCERFVFSSTCSNYGRMSDPSAMVDEGSELKGRVRDLPTVTAADQPLHSHVSEILDRVWFFAARPVRFDRE